MTTPARIRARDGAAPQLYRWHWRKRMPERHGELFTVLARGQLNACMIRFERDGWVVITSRNALRKV
jgi:hypothetical protein